MDQWKQDNGIFRHLRRLIVNGTLSTSTHVTQTIDLRVEAPLEGMPVRVEGTMTEADWVGLKSNSTDRRFILRAKSGITDWLSDDVIPDGAEYRHGNVEFALRLNHLLKTTTGPSTDRRDETVAGIEFGGVDFLVPRFDPRKHQLVSDPIRLKANGWNLKLEPIVGYPKAAKGIDGLIVPRRTYLGLRSDELAKLSNQSPTQALALVRDVGDSAAAVLSLLALRPIPWLRADHYRFTVDTREFRQYFVTARSADVSALSLTSRDLLKRAFGSGLRTLLRLKETNRTAALALTEAVFLFASAAQTQDLRRSWYTLSLCLDVLQGCSDFRVPQTSEEKRTIKDTRKELKDLARKSVGISDHSREFIRGSIQSVGRVSYPAGIESLVRKTNVDLARFGGSDFVRDIVDIRNGLMHRGSLSNQKIDGIQKRGSKRDLEFRSDDLPRFRVGLQLMRDRHRHVVCLTARILLRLLRVPDAAVPVAWSDFAFDEF